MVNTDDCWLWAGIVSKMDYGIVQVKIGKTWRTRRAHRIVYESEVGEIPDELVLDHLCRVHRCVNPQHLDPVTTKVNILRGIGTGAKYAARTHCAKGHEFTLANTVLRADGGRRCRICRNAWWVKYYHNHLI